MQSDGRVNPFHFKPLETLNFFKNDLSKIFKKQFSPRNVYFLIIMLHVIANITEYLVSVTNTND